MFVKTSKGTTHRVKKIEDDKSNDVMTFKRALRMARMTRLISISVIISMLMIMSTFATPALAEGSDDDGDDLDDELEEEQERNVDIDVEEDKVEIHSVLKVGDTLNEIEFEMDADEGIKISMKYNDDDSTDETEIEVTIEFREILEFGDTDNDGTYGHGDELVSTYDLRDADYKDIGYRTEVTLDNEMEHVITAETTDGVFALILHVASSYVIIDSGPLTPLEVKFDIIIDRYPYKEDGTQLALGSKVETEADVEDGHEHEASEEEDGHDVDESEVHITSGEVQAFLSWANIATVDGVEKPVQANILTDDEGDVDLYFVFERGDLIVYDPTIGIPFPGTNDGGISGIVPYFVALAVGSTAIAMALIWRRKKNGYH